MAKDNALQKQRDQIAQAVGSALASWTLVEAALTYVFVALLDRTKKPVAPGLTLWSQEERGRRMAHTLFNAIQALDTRVDVVTALVTESGINKDLRSVWPGIAERVLKRYRKGRHPIAHFMIANVEQDDGRWKATLIPFATSVGSYSEKGLGLAEINHKAESFLEIRDALIWYREAIEQSRGRRKVSVGPEPPVIERVRQTLRDRSRQAPPSPPQSSHP